MLKSTKTGVKIPHLRQEPGATRGGLNAFSLAGLGIGGVIGAGFFLGSGLAVQEAGPAVALAFLIGGLVMMQVLGAMTSINVNRLQPGSFRVYTEHFLGSYAGFLMGWAVFTSSILGIGSEAIAMGVFVRYWMPHVPLSLLATLFTLIVIGLNALNMQNFGRIESGMSALKALAILAFILLGGYALFTHGVFVTPSPISSFSAFFPKGISGVLQSMLIVIFSFSGISAVAMAATEVEKPRVDIPRAANYMSFGVIALYVLSMLVLCAITAWSTVTTDRAPFVQAFQTLGLGWAANGLNVIIVLAAFSVMAASYYASTQMIVSLADAEKAPQRLRRHSARGFYRNAWLAVAIGVLVVVGLSFLLPSGLYNYLVSASSYFTFLNWALNLVTYLFWRKRRGMEETYHSPLIWGRGGAYVTILAILVLLVMSLRVHDFRMGFYAALAVVSVISIAYGFWISRHRQRVS